METTDNLGLKKPSEEDIYDVKNMNDNMDIIDRKYQEVFLRGNEVKQILVSKLIAFNVAADTSETFESLFEKMDSISTGVDTSDDTVVEGALLEGYTAHNANQEQIVGTLPDKTGTTDHSAEASLDGTNSRLKMKIPILGRYGTSNYLFAAFSTIASLIGLTANKLVNGNTVLGISGNSNNMDTSSADAAESNILSGKKAGVKGSLLTGTMPNNGTVTKTLDTSTTSVAIAQGYHDGNGKVSLTTETKTVTLSTSASQDITPSTGKVLSKVTVPKVNLQSKSASLSTSAQTIKPDSAYNGLSQVTVPAVTGNADKSNVLSGKTFNSATAGIGQSGTMPNKAGTTVEASAVSQDDDYTYLTIPANGYYNTSSKVKTANSNLGNELTVTLRCGGFNNDGANGYIYMPNTHGMSTVAFSNIVKSSTVLKQPYIEIDGTRTTINVGTVYDIKDKTVKIYVDTTGSGYSYTSIDATFK